MVTMIIQVMYMFVVMVTMIIQVMYLFVVMVTMIIQVMYLFVVMKWLEPLREIMKMRDHSIPAMVEGEHFNRTTISSHNV